MAIDPQVASLAAAVMALIAILGQVVMYFVKAPRESDNGYKKQVEINADNIASLTRDVRDGTRRLGTLEEQMKNSTLEILNMRPRLHQMGNELNRLTFADEERHRGKRT